MILRCPSCGRDGNLPDRLCRPFCLFRVRCEGACGKAVFPPVAPRGNRELRVNWNKTTEDAALDAYVRDAASSSPAEFSAGSDVDIAAFAPPTSYDSQYEMTAVLGGDPDDIADGAYPLLRDDGTGSAEIESVRSFDTGSAEIMIPVPWYFNVIASWGRLHFYLATGFGAASLAVLGFLLVRALVSGAILSSSVTALLVGCVRDDRVPLDLALGNGTHSSAGRPGAECASAPPANRAPWQSARSTQSAQEPSRFSQPVG